MADRQRRDHAQEAIDVKVLNDQEEADVDIQHAEFLASTVFANAHVENIESKLRTVSFQWGEDVYVSRFKWWDLLSLRNIG